MISLHNSILNYYHYLRTKDEGQRSKVKGRRSKGSSLSPLSHLSPLSYASHHQLLFRERRCGCCIFCFMRFCVAFSSCMAALSSCSAFSLLICCCCCCCCCCWFCLSLSCFCCWFFLSLSLFLSCFAELKIISCLVVAGIVAQALLVCLYSFLKELVFLTYHANIVIGH